MKKSDVSHRKMKILIFIIILVGSPLLALLLLNIPYIYYLSDDIIEQYKEDMEYFSIYHQNPTSGLYVQPSIDANYRAINTTDVSTPPAINPLDNPFLKAGLEDFYVDFLMEKQNTDGSFSDMGGSGEMEATYQVVNILDRLLPNYWSQNQDKKDKIIEYLKDSIIDDDVPDTNISVSGFRSDEESNEPDIVSTYYGIALAQRFNVITEVITPHKDDIISFIEALAYLPLLPHGNDSYCYSLSEKDTYNVENTYFGVKAYFALGKDLNVFSKDNMQKFFWACRDNRADAGYSPQYPEHDPKSEDDPSDVESTYYALDTLYRISRDPDETNATESSNFIYMSQKSDGGFAKSPNKKYGPEWKSGWAAINALKLLEKEIVNFTANSTTFDIYYEWGAKNQAENGLFGDITIESNHLGVLSVDLIHHKTLDEIVNKTSISDFVIDCFNPEDDDGGFGANPYENSTMSATYYALELFRMFDNFGKFEQAYGGKRDKNYQKVARFIRNQQNKDGGFRIGDDIDDVAELFGGSGDIADIVDPEESTAESTFWAVASFELLPIEIEGAVEMEDLIHWILSCQNADGGFPMYLGYHSDVISSFYALEVIRILNIKALSRISCIEFIKDAQDDDGAFIIIPALRYVKDMDKSFFGTYCASRILYDSHTQAENITTLIEWYCGCMSDLTGGMGDIPGFGGDLRNIPYSIIIIDEYRIDQSFDTSNINQMLIIIIIIEVIVFASVGVLKLMTTLNVSVARKVQSRRKNIFNISYLQKNLAINCEDISIFIGKKWIINNVSMQLEHGEILGVIGESGAGKTTFVKGLLGLRNYVGTSQIYGIDSTKARLLKRIYGYCPQDLRYIYHAFTVMENLIHFGKRYGMTENEIITKSRRILKNLEIEDKENQVVKTLSGGEMKRASIAIALVHSPIFCILDEPTSGLDPIIREKLWEQLVKINESFNTTLIVITHYPEEAVYCHKVAIFDRKKGLRDFGKPIDLLAQLPGRGRKIELTFIDPQKDVAKRLESIVGVEKVLEMKPELTYYIFSDLDLNLVYNKIIEQFGAQVIYELIQSDTLMQDYFRYKALEVSENEPF